MSRPVRGRLVESGAKRRPLSAGRGRGVAMDSVLQVLGWLLLALGAVFAVPALVALIARRHPGSRGAHRSDARPNRAKAWSDLGAGTSAMAIGLSDVAGRAAHGVL